MCDSLISVRHPVSGAETEMTVEAFFKGVTIPYPYLEESSFRDAVTKFCRLGMLWFYCDDNDNIKFVSARPKMLQGERERAYEYPKSRTYGTTSTEVFLKNKVKDVNATITQLTPSNSTVAGVSFEGYSYDAQGNLDTYFSNRNEYEIELVNYHETEGVGAPADLTLALFLRYEDIAPLYKLTGDIGLGGNFSRTGYWVRSQGQSAQTLTRAEVLEVGNNFSGSVYICDTYDEFKQTIYKWTENSIAIIKGLSSADKIAVASGIRTKGAVVVGTPDEETEYTITVSMRVSMNTLQKKTLYKRYIA